MELSASSNTASFLLLLSLLIAFQGTSGSGKVTVLLLNYGNSKSQLADGRCCDNVNWCVNDCDNFFRLCLALTTSSDKCALWKGWTSVLGDDSFSFPSAGGSLGNGIVNPLSYSFTSWQPIVFNVEVWDNDDGNIVGADKDFVDRYSLTIQTNPSPNLASATAKRYKLTGPGSSHLNVEVKVFCDANYFVPDCSTYCEARNDNTGHYTCDYTRGQRVCLSGWYGSDCLTYCMARNDTLGHYSCDGNGQRQCLDNWYGQSCLVYCKPRDDTSGHYSCDGNGQKRCLDSWYGQGCLVYCKPRNDTLGHYSCDGNGQRHCLDNWYGHVCVVYCKPRNDTRGHYTCNSTGHIDCFTGWTGKNCTEEIVTSSSTAVSLAVTSSTLLVSTATRATTQLTPSSVYISLNSSTYDVHVVNTMSSVQSRVLTKSHGFSTSKNSHGEIQTKLPHSSLLKTTSTLNAITMESVSFITTARTTSRTNDVSKSSLVPRRSLYVLPSQPTTYSEFTKLQTTEATRTTLRSVHRTPLLSGTSTSSSQTGASTLISTPLVVSRCATERAVTAQPTETSNIAMSSAQLDRTLGLQNLASLSQLSSPISTSSSREGEPTLKTKPSVGSTLHTTEKDVTDQQTKTARMAISSMRVYSTLGLQHDTSSPQLSSPTSASSSQTDTPALMSTSTIWLLCTSTKKIITEPTETRKTKLPLSFKSTLGTSYSSSSGLQYQTPSSQEFLIPSASSPHTVASTLMSTPSVGWRCDSNEEVTAPPTVHPEETSAIPGIMVQFQPVKEDQELLIPWVVRTIKTVLAEQLNTICRRNSEACDSSEEDIYSAWFCPRDINVEIHDVTEKGVSFKVTSSLPPPLKKGMVPLQTLMEVLKERKEVLESATQANINWIRVFGLTTPRLSYKKPDQLARVSSRQNTIPLPYIFGIAGAGVILVVVLLVVRAKLAKNRVQPCVDDEMPPSPAYECQADTIVLLSRTKGKHVCKDKEKAGLNEGYDVHPPGAVEENNL